MSDLFDGQPRTPQQAAKVAAERQTKATRERQHRHVDRAVRDRVRQLENIVDALGAKMTRSPDDTSLGKLFHTACDRLHDAETALYPIAPELGGKRLESPSEIPRWIGAVLTDIGRDFQPQNEATRCERAA